MAFLYPQHVREEQTKEQRESIIGFLGFLSTRKGVNLNVIKELSTPLDEFFGIDREAYAKETVEMERKKKQLEHAHRMGRPPGSTIPSKR